MATIQQSINLHKNKVGIDQTSFTATIAILRTISRFMRRVDVHGIGNNSGIGDSGSNVSNGSNSGTNDINKVVDELKDIEAVLEKIQPKVDTISKHTKSIEDILKTMQDTLNVMKENSTETGVDKFNNALPIIEAVGKVAGAVVVGAALLRENGDGAIRDHLNEKYLGPTDPNSTTETGTDASTDKQAELETALNNLKTGIETWKADNALSWDEKQTKIDSILNNLKSGIGTWRTDNELSEREKQVKLDDVLNNLMDGVGKWRKDNELSGREKQTKLEDVLNNLKGGIAEWRKDTAPKDREKQARLEELLNNLKGGVDKWRADNALSEREKQTKLEDILNNLKAGINTWRKNTAPKDKEKQARLETALNNLASGIENWRKDRELSPKNKQKKLDGLLNNLSSGIENWRKDRELKPNQKQDKLETVLNNLSKGIETWRKDSKPSPDEKQAQLNERLNALLKGISDWRESIKASDKSSSRMAQRQENEQRLQRKEALKASIINGTRAIAMQFLKMGIVIASTVKVLQRVFEAFAKYISVVFIEPINTIEQQFIGLGQTIYNVMSSIVSSLNSLFSNIMIPQPTSPQGSMEGSSTSGVDTSSMTSPSFYILPNSEGSSAMMPGSQSASYSASSPVGTSAAIQRQQSAHTRQSRDGSFYLTGTTREPTQRAVNKTYNINIVNNNNINNEMNIRDVVHKIASGIDRAMQTSAEGVMM